MNHQNSSCFCRNTPHAGAVIIPWIPAWVQQPVIPNIPGVDACELACCTGYVNPGAEPKQYHFTNPGIAVPPNHQGWVDCPDQNKKMPVNPTLPQCGVQAINFYSCQSSRLGITA